MKKLLFVTFDKSPLDCTGWSGTPNSIFSQLMGKYEIDIFVISRFCSLSAAAGYVYESVLLRKRNLFYLSEAFAKKASAQLNKVLKASKYDCIFTLNSAAIAYVKTDVPIVYFCDATFKNMVDYYWFGLSDKKLIEHDDIQKKALMNADHIICASEWARNSVINDYGIDGKTSVAHMGANVDCSDTSVLEHKGINLLFVGKDYVRKGAMTAIECVKRLNAREDGNVYRLHMVGGTPKEFDSKDVHVYGVLNRDVREEKNMLEDLWRSADIFILPTSAECAGLVFCEASAFGVPSVTYSTGGVPDYVRNGENGICLPLDSDAEAFADAIQEIVNSPEKFKQMKKRAEEIFIEELNWPVFGNKVAEIIDGLD